MAKWSSESELFDGTLAFSGEGIASSPRDVDVQGTVSPEPASMVLLGTGLMGVVGAARRRRVAKMTD